MSLLRLCAVIFVITCATESTAFAKEWSFLNCIRILSKSANDPRIVDFDQIVSKIPESELGLDFQVPWSNSIYHQPDGIFEVKRSINETDLALWELSKNNKGHEVALIEVFDSEGIKLWQSRGIVGNSGNIPGELIYDELDRFLYEMARASTELKRPTIRFTHTHPPNGATPHMLSGGDIGATQQVRQHLDRFGLEDANFEMIAVTNSSYSIGEIRDLPNLWKKVGASFGSKRWAKPSIIYPGR